MTADLPRKLNLLDATTIVAGTMIGAGIFLIPSILDRDLPSIPWIFVVWVIGGIASICGALAYAELGAMLPHSGGQYVYLREAYGPLPAFLVGWAFFLIIHSGSIAAVTNGFAIYLRQFVPWAPQGPTAVVLIAVLTFINYIGVRKGADVQNIFTALKFAGLLLLIVSALFYSEPSHLTDKIPGSVTMGGFGLALLGAFVAYDGWHVIAFVAGEVINPKRNIPLALVLGVTAVMAVYLLANVAYHHVLPLATIIASPRTAVATAQATMGSIGATLIGLTIVCSTLGAGNGAILTAPRIYFAQARDGLFFHQFARVHPKFLTPGFSIVAQGVWTSLLAVSGQYELIIAYVMFISWMIHGAAVLAVPILRKKRPELARPYRMWGSPVIPLLFVAFTVWFIANTLAERPLSSIVGGVLLLSGIPVYYHWRKRTPQA